MKTTNCKDFFVVEAIEYLMKGKKYRKRCLTEDLTTYVEQVQTKDRVQSQQTIQYKFSSADTRLQIQQSLFKGHRIFGANHDMTIIIIS